MDLDYDFYMFIDDDTFVYTDRVEEYIKGLDSSLPLYVGQKLTHEPVPFMSGGAGFLLSKPLYKHLRQHLNAFVDKYHGDLSIGYWIANTDITGLQQIHEPRFRSQPCLHEKNIVLTSHYLKTFEDFLAYM
jgi:hypothetical protein